MSRTRNQSPTPSQSVDDNQRRSVWFNSESPSLSFSPSSSFSSADDRLGDRMEVTNSSVSESFNFFRLNRALFPNSQVINCERENIFADLAKHAEKLNHRLGTSCPQSSPVKPKPLLMIRNNEENKRFVFLLTQSIDRIEIDSINKDIIKADDYNGRNYGRLMSAARSLQRQLMKKDDKFFENFIPQGKYTPDSDFINILRKDLSTMQLIAFMLLTDKYPLFSPKTICMSLQNEQFDVFEAYKKIDNLLYTSTLTKEASKTFLFEKEFKKSFGVSESMMVEDVTDDAEVAPGFQSK